LNQTTTYPDPTWAWDILWVGLLALYTFAGTPLTPFHGDESMQIFMSRDYHYLFQQGDLDALIYTDEKTQNQDLEQNLRILNGTINKYTIGLAWDLAGYSVDDLNWPWYWEEDYQFNLDGGFHPGESLLYVSRVPSALFLSGSIVLIFFTAKLFAGRPVAYMATGYYALSPAVLVNGRRAMMEGSLLFGALWVLLAGLLWVRLTGRGRLWSTVALAIGAGFAVASKHPNVVGVAAVFIGCAVYALSQWRSSGPKIVLQNLVQLIVAGVVSLLIFLLFNQAYWSNPVEVVRAVLDQRVTLLDSQVAGFGGYASPLEQVMGLYRQVFDGRPMYAEAPTFAEAMEVQGAAYESTPYAGLYLPGFSVFLFAMFALGCVIVFGGLSLPDIQSGTRWLIGTYTIVMSLFLVFAIPLEWQRYYLPMFPVVAIVAPLGVVKIVRIFLQNAEQQSPQYKKGSARVQRSS
jgi:MFS family permease